MDINRLAVFIAEVGYDEAESLTGVDADLLQKAVAGEPLSNYESAIIDNGYSGMVLANDDYIDLDRINEIGDKLNLADGFINDTELADSFRESFSFGQVDLDLFFESGWKMFPNLGLARIADIVDYLSDNPDDTLDDAILAFMDDKEDIFSRDLEDSAFWEWFRCIFYGECDG